MRSSPLILAGLASFFPSRMSLFAGDCVAISIFSTFALTREEKLLLATVLGVALVGLIARYVHLRGIKPVPYVPANLPASMQAEPIEQ